MGYTQFDINTVDMEELARRISVEASSLIISGKSSTEYRKCPWHHEVRTYAAIRHMGFDDFLEPRDVDKLIVDFFIACGHICPKEITAEEAGYPPRNGKATIVRLYYSEEFMKLGQDVETT